jgi:hypothetical protein
MELGELGVVEDVALGELERLGEPDDLAAFDGAEEPGELVSANGIMTAAVRTASASPIAGTRWRRIQEVSVPGRRPVPCCGG